MSDAKNEKIARAIRAGVDGDYDLANYETDQVNTMVASGFTDPIECSEMFRVSFCVGGGKKVRQKYGDGRVVKDLTAALQGLGFEDDKGASCCLASAGSYKYQHNTDTDLKTVHVFPHVTITQQAAGSDEAPKEKGPVQLIVEFDMDVFESSIAIKVQSFGQKKMLLSVLKMVVAQLAEIDQKLMSMEALTPSEDARYNSANQVADKVEWLQQQCQKHVDEGNLTRLEQQSEANNIRAKLEALAGQAAEADGNAKKLKKLDAKKAALDTQLEKITSATPTKITIKHAMDILKLQASARHLGRSIEDNSATMADIKEHSNVLAKIDKLKDEQDEAYWFQDPDLVEKVALPTKKKGGKKGPAGTKGGKVVLMPETIESFSLLKMMPPTTTDSVASAVETLKAKKEAFKTMPRGQIKSIAELNQDLELAAERRSAPRDSAAAENKSGHKKGGAQKKVDVSSTELFPTLGGK